MKYGHRLVLSESRDPAGRCARTVSVSAFLPASDVTVSCFRDARFPCGAVSDPQAPRGSYRGFVLEIASVSRASAALITRFYPRRRRAVGAHTEAGRRSVAARCLKYRSLTALLRSVRTLDSLCANESLHPLAATHHG